MTSELTLLTLYTVYSVNSDSDLLPLHTLVGRLSLPEASEIVLEYIIERKRMDDLSKSILDKRFSEQKAGPSDVQLDLLLLLLIFYYIPQKFTKLLP